MWSLSDMSGQKYRRTNFDEDEVALSDPSIPSGHRLGGTAYHVSSAGDHPTTVVFKASLSFCHRRTILERFLLFLLFACLIAIIVLASMVSKNSPMLLHLSHEPHELEQHSDLCLSPECVTVAGSLLKSMDSSVDPCSDFYTFACGNWMKNNPIPSGHSSWGTMGVMGRKNLLVMKNSLEQVDGDSDSTAIRKARDYYLSCMDANKTIEKLTATPLLSVIDRIGGWNISYTGRHLWRSSDFDFQQVVESLESIGVSSLFFAWVGNDAKNSNKNILTLDQGGLTLPRQHYLNKTIENDTVLTAYHKMMTEIGVLLGGDRNSTREQMLQVIELEIELAKVTVPPEERRDNTALYNRYSVKRFQKIAPFLNWERFFNSLLKVTDYRITADEPVIVLVPEYFKKLSVLVSEKLKTDGGKTVLNNFLMWRIVNPLSGYLSKGFRDVKKEFTEVLSGASGNEELWRLCASDTDSVLGFALGLLFINKAFDGNSRKEAENMVSEVKWAFKSNLPHLKWMDDKTRKLAEEKAAAIIDMIGFPNFITNKTALDLRYENLQINADEYFLNNLRNMKYSMKRNLDKLRRKPDKYSWNMSPPTINAYYTPTKNEIVLPAGILQTPFYHRNYPRSLNFGGMGVVMGHELTHGFDDQGREYDKNGVLRQWWGNDSITRFKAQAECLIKQYSKYEINGKSINGKTTIGENIADNGGLKSAYYAYQDWRKHHGDENPLPGLKYTHNQLFFIAFSQVWCMNQTPQAALLEILSDDHSPPKFRVIGSLSNSKEFAEAFKCPAGSKMNPPDKCVVW